MYAIKSDLSKNRLYITVNGSITADELPEYSKDLKRNVNLLKAGFTALLDLRKTSVLNQEMLKGIQDTKQIAVEGGLAKSAMIVESATLKLQMNRIFKDVGPKDMAFTEISEGEMFLNE